MKLYQLTASGIFVATQEEAKKAGGPFAKVEVPTTEGRVELATFLNNVVAEALETPPPVEPMPTPIVAQVAQAIDAGRAKQFTANDIADFIFDDASVAMVENIMAAIGTRVAELAKAARNG